MNIIKKTVYLKINNAQDENLSVSHYLMVSYLLFGVAM